MFFRNTKVMFGLPGPYRAISKEALADELTNMFFYWTYQILEPLLPYVEDNARDKLVDDHVDQLRESFINGLIESNEA